MGSWISEVKAKILEIVDAIRETHLISSFRVGVIGFRDHPPQDRSFITRSCPLLPTSSATDFRRLTDFINKMSASGGGDIPEALVPALFDLNRLQWRTGRDIAKVAILITDAPPHGVGSSGDGFPHGDPSGESYMEQVRSAAESGITIHCLTCGTALLTVKVCSEISLGANHGVCVTTRQSSVLKSVILATARDIVDRKAVREKIVGMLLLANDGVGGGGKSLIEQIEDQIEDEFGRVCFVLGKCEAEGIRRRLFCDDDGENDGGKIMDADDDDDESERNTLMRELCVSDIEEAIRETVLIGKDRSEEEEETSTTTTTIKLIERVFPRVAAGKSSRVLAPGLYPTTKNGSKSEEEEDSSSSDETVSLLPLEKVDIDVSVVSGLAAKISLTQTFRNTTKTAIEAVYKFPLSSSGSSSSCVYRFVAEINGKKLIGKCLEKERAREVYDDAIAAGGGAYLLQEITPELFEVSVGNLPPGAVCVITIEYVAELQVTSSAEVYKLSFPSNLAPKKGGGEEEMEEQMEVGIGMCVVDMEGISFSCPSHELVERKEREGEGEGESFFSLANVQNGLLNDVVLLFRISSEGKEEEEQQEEEEEDITLPPATFSPRVFVEAKDANGKAACMVDFVPTQGLTSYKGQSFEDPIILMVDCSSSMKLREELIREAIDEFIQQLSTFHCEYNVVFFACNWLKALPDDEDLGSSVEILGRKEEILSKFELFGGSEIHAALSDVISMGGGKDRRKNVLLLSDGHMTDVSRIVADIGESDGAVRIFPIGLGDSIDSFVLGEVARASDGFFARCSGGESVRDSVRSQLNRMLLSWTNLKVSADCQLPLIAPQTRSSLFLLLDSLEEPIILSGTDADGIRQTISFDLKIAASTPLSDSYSEGIIHTIAARKLIDFLQENGSSVDEIVSVATTYNVASQHTSFVAVEEREDSEISESMETIELEAGQLVVTEEEAEEEEGEEKRDDVDEKKPKIRHFPEDPFPPDSIFRSAKPSNSSGGSSLTFSRSSRTSSSSSSSSYLRSSTTVGTEWGPSSSSTSYEDSQSLVLDCGSYLWKAGFSGDDAPRDSFRSLVGRIPPSDGKFTPPGGEPRDTLVGDDVVTHGHRFPSMETRSPVRYGMICNWNDWEKLLHHSFYTTLRVQPEEHPVLLSETALNPKVNREKMTSILFETFNLPAAKIEPEPTLAIYSTGRTTGQVLGVGHQFAYATPVYEGYALPHAILKSPIGGEIISNLLSHSFPELDERAIRSMKEAPDLCFVRPSSGDDPTTETASVEREKFELPDGTGVEVGEIRRSAPEVLFGVGLDSVVEKPDPGVYMSPEMLPLQKLCADSIARCDSDITKDLAQNVVLVGGSSLFPGMSERLCSELARTSTLADFRVNVCAPEERAISSWIGGSILSSLSTFSSIWTSKDEYDDAGATIVHRKCFGGGSSSTASSVMAAETSKNVPVAPPTTTSSSTRADKTSKRIRKRVKTGGVSIVPRRRKKAAAVAEEEEEEEEGENASAAALGNLRSRCTSDKLEMILARAVASGEFGMAVLTEVVGLSEELIRSKKPASFLSEELWITAIVVVILELFYGDQSEKWSSLIETSKKLLEGMSMTEAKAFVSSLL